MQRPQTLLICILVILASVSVPGTVTATGPTEALPVFTYQGNLNDGGSPANGLYDFEMKIFDCDVGGTEINAQIFDDVMVTDGRFQVDLFVASDGKELFLEIGIRPGASGGGFTTSATRVQLRPVPMAITLVPGATIRGFGSLINTGLLVLEDAAGIQDGLLVTTFSGQAIRAESINSAAITALTGGALPALHARSTLSGDAVGLQGEAYDAAATVDSKGVYGNNKGLGVGVLGEHELTTGTEPGVKGITASTSADAAGVTGVVSSTSPGGFSAGVRGDNMGTGAAGVGVWGSHDGTGWGVYGSALAGTGVYGYSSSGTAISAHCGSGDVFYGRNTFGTVFRVTNSGNVQADGTYTSPAADFAEMLPASDDAEPADVLIVGSDGALRRSGSAFDPAVAGVYSTRPAFLGGATDEYENEIPLAVVGVVPVKVTNENGPIAPGDLLVASSKPGHAMRGGVNPPNGTVIGKSLQSLDAKAGVVKAILMLQ